jgi:heme oxygenase
MAAGREAADGEPKPRDGADVLRSLRTATAREHERVETALDLLNPDLDRARLTDVLGRLHTFWRAAEAGLDDWAAREPEAAGAVDWARRRRSALFAADLAALGAAAAPGLPDLPDVEGTDEALGRMYVLEGSTLGGTFIDRHLANLPTSASG